MMKLEHEFVEFIPKELGHEKLYISIRFKTAVHLCACGCGMKTVTPLSPTDWKLTFDSNGLYPLTDTAVFRKSELKTVSLYPSIGNWGFKCRSHYWVTNNKIIWSTDWSDEEIEIGRQISRTAKEKYYSQSDEKLSVDSSLIKERGPWWKFW